LRGEHGVTSISRYESDPILIKGVSGSLRFLFRRFVIDLGGPFTQTSFGAAGGLSMAGDTYGGQSPNGYVTGTEVTMGLGLGGGGSFQLTGTQITPIGNVFDAFGNALRKLFPPGPGGATTTSDGPGSSEPPVELPFTGNLCAQARQAAAEYSDPAVLEGFGYGPGR
jgi:hypothetical protein